MLEREELTESPGILPVAPDDISEVVGCRGYISGWSHRDCALTYEAGRARQRPYRFSRRYFRAGEPVVALVDVIPNHQALERRRDEIAFKRGWCAERAYRYAVVVGDDFAELVGDEPLEALLTDQGESQTDDGEPSDEGQEGGSEDSGEAEEAGEGSGDAQDVTAADGEQADEGEMAAAEMAPYHKGGGWYALPGGAQVQGAIKARDALAAMAAQPA